MLPSIEVPDIISIIDTLKQDRRLAKSRVVLLGWSEGTIIASLVAEQAPGKVDALFLAGYAHDDLFDVIATQYGGRSQMVSLLPVFDSNEDGMISPEEYDSDEAGVKKVS